MATPAARRCLRTALTEFRTRIGETALEPEIVRHAPGQDVLDTVALGRIEVGVGEGCRAEVQLVLKLHVVDAGLPGKRTGARADAALDVVRRLSLEVKGRRHAERRARHALVDIGHAEAARRPPEERDLLRNPVLHAHVPGVLHLAGVVGQPLRTGEQSARRIRIPAVACADRIALHARAEGDVGVGARRATVSWK